MRSWRANTALEQRRLFRVSRGPCKEGSDSRKAGSIRVPTKKPTNLGRCGCGTAGRTDLAVLLFLFVPAKNPHCSFKLLVRLGVHDGI
jgi:hypothetical protein